VIYAPDGDDDLLARLEPRLTSFGFGGESGPDTRLVVVPAGEGDAALPGAVSAVLSDREPRPGFDWVPHFGVEDIGLLRRMAETTWGVDLTAQPPSLTPDDAWSVLQDRVGAPALDGERALYEGYVADLEAYQSMPGAEAIDGRDLMPMVHDKTPTTPYDGHYFYQDIWAARRIAESRPAHHVDVGSRVDYVGFLTAITEVTFVDIRPLPVNLDRFNSVAGSLLDLPFEDRSLESVSCLHVAEHIGLGRYGDPLDPKGTERAAAELQRVLAPGGQLLFAVPVGRPRTCFNAHRIFDPYAVLEMFPELELVEFAGVDDVNSFRRERSLDELVGANYACGMFRLARR
jgi:SAM-dependent methyltransferase